jgi:hypothetical protein
MNDPDLEAIAEQRAAQAAALSCEISLHSIRKGLNETVSFCVCGYFKYKN